MASSSSTSASFGVPPGFRFHPTDEELLHYYLKKKILFEKFEIEVIREVDLNRLEPWDLQERCRIGSAPQNEWYFFSHKDRKYPTGSRTNRATNAGFWKATGRDKCIRDSFRKIGMRKTLVFYRGRAPHGQKSDWIMHEYRLEDSEDTQPVGTEDGWVVCRVFKKKNFFKIAGANGSDEGGSGGMGQGGGIEEHMGLPLMVATTDQFHMPTQYIHSEQQEQEQEQLHHFNSSIYKPPSDLGLQYTHLQSHHYPPQIQVQNLLPDHRQTDSGPNYDFSALPGELDVSGGGHGGDENDWTMLGRFGNTTATTEVHHMNQMPNSRGEMDLWGYGKQQ